MFIHENFLLHSKFAERLFHEYAANQPIVDYHTHLPPRQIAEDWQFSDLSEIWLTGDHYKWRLMRANGVDEHYCTGSAKPYEKFLAWARTVPAILGNPLYHWSHLELQRYFGITDLLHERTAEATWKQANEQLASGELNAQNILRRFRVHVVCTTDDPADGLAEHQAIQASDCTAKVFPTYRLDRAFAVDDPVQFNTWVDRLSSVSELEIGSLPQFLDALKQRHDAFHELGCRLSDHGLAACFPGCPDERAAARVFDKVRCGAGAGPEERDAFGSYLMVRCTQWDVDRGWTKQLHLGAIRNNSDKGFKELGPDTGFDSIGDYPQIEALGRYMSTCEAEFGLPRMVLYNLNPADNYPLATMAGNYQDGRIPGKIQFGAAWWFLDQKQGIESQLQTLANVGLLWRFVGMLTDSRSFMSFPRHEYFRRVLCNWLGGQMHRGELPDDLPQVGELVRRICHQNAVDHFRLGE